MLIDHLRSELSARTQKNANYSLRAFAKSLEIDPSTLSALLRNKRALSAKTAKKLIEALDIQDVNQRREIFARSFETSDLETPQYTELEQETFEVISSWEHFAILALLELTDRNTSLRSISRSLEIPGQTAADALERLQKLGLVVERFGRWQLTKANLATISNVPNAALRKNNRQHIELALVALERDSVDDRDITGITMAVDKEKLPEAKAMIKDFRRRLSAFMENGNKNAVFRLNVQLFSLTHEEKT